MDGEQKAGSWAAVWVMGELSDLQTYQKVADYLANNVRDVSGAKIFQGTASGNPAVYIVYRQ